MATAVHTVRDLVNTPPSDLYPETLAAAAVDLGDLKAGDVLTVDKVFKEKQRIDVTVRASSTVTTGYSDPSTEVVESSPRVVAMPKVTAMMSQKGSFQSFSWMRPK